jgi:apolipoprotein N-acyltransferase
MTRRNRLLLSVLSGLLLSLGWVQWGTGPVLFVALIPLLFNEDFFAENRDCFSSLQVFWHALLAFVVWNSLSIWWIWNASAIGMFLAILINSSFLAFFFWLAHLVKRHAGRKAGWFALVTFWIFWEHFYLNGEISFPWLTLGNGFANNHRLVQWYEYTGAFGGSLWVLTANILLFSVLRTFLRNEGRKKIWLLLAVSLSWVLLPMLLSLVIYAGYKEEQDPYRIVVIQPNIDPYEKFVGISSEEQTRILTDLAAGKSDSTVDYFVAPDRP